MNTYNLIDVYAPLMVMFSGEVSGGPGLHAYLPFL